MSRGNFIGITNIPSNTSVTGVWNLYEQYNAVSGNTWLYVAPFVPIISTGLVLNYDVGNTSSYPGTGTTWTSLVGGSTATLTNGPTFTSAGSASYFTLDGSNDYILLPFIETNAAFTLEFWALQTTTSTGATLFSGVNGQPNYLQLRMSPSGMSLVKSYNFEMGGFGATSATTLNTINQLVLTRSSLTYSAYTNGVFRSSFTTDAGGFITSNQAIGLNSFASEPFSGRIYVFRYYNTVLSAADITQNFNALRGRYGL